MVHFCSKCGAKLGDGVRFCQACGTPVVLPTPEQKHDTQKEQGTQKEQETRKEQGAQKEQETQKEQDTREAPDIKQDHKTSRGAINEAAKQGKAAAPQAIQAPVKDLTEQIASSAPGEAVLGVFGGIQDGTASASEILGPFRTVLSGISSSWQNLIGLFKNKRWIKLFIAVAVAVVWAVLLVLSYNKTEIGFLNWLTFAQGGVGRGVFGWIGGLLGKTAVAALFVSLFTGGFKSLGRGSRSLFSQSNFKTQNLCPLFSGAGCALILYQFFAGAAELSDTMSAVSGALLAVMAMGRGNGFIFRTARSFTAKKTGNNRFAQSEKLTGLLSGAAYGFALAAAISAIPFGYLPVIFGGVCLIAGIVFTIVSGNKKEAAAV